MLPTDRLFPPLLSIAIRRSSAPLLRLDTYRHVVNRGVRIIAEYTDPSQYTGAEIGRACGCGVNSFGDDK